MTEAWLMAEREYRRQIRRRAFSESQLQVLDLVLALSLARARPRALVPKQLYIARLTGLDEGDTSRTLAWLADRAVIYREGIAYGLLPPEAWDVPLRRGDIPSNRDLEDWLSRLDPDQPEFF